MNFLGIIPARFASSRLPGKPLADIGGKPMIQWVYENSRKELNNVIVATDHAGIEQAVLAFGGRVMMTSPEHPSGTDRCAEVIQSLARSGEEYDVIINIQGDEPFIHASHIRLLKDAFYDPGTQIATLAFPIESSSELFNPNAVKVVTGSGSNALYFSRSAIPYNRNTVEDNWTSTRTYLKHIGMYAYRAEILQKITALELSPLETTESLEQLRWLENGFGIKVLITTGQSHGIDTPEDLENARKRAEKEL
ncbi:MAG: 3-deoxy-manno-octulosonate cytidylyltransferase [Bacteroidales bacterium]|nr:3-deoxy-manno-octulosonate cytidylyltransferase [Bacteroidales bacterium]